MIERIKYWLAKTIKNEKQCKSCCLWCEFYQECKKDIQKSLGHRSKDMDGATIIQEVQWYGCQNHKKRVGFRKIQLY